jgi:hypothetical protein
MLHSKFQRAMCALALAGAVGYGSSAAHAGTVKSVFVIAMENHNWTQPSTPTSPQQMRRGNCDRLVRSVQARCDQVAVSSTQCVISSEGACTLLHAPC